MVYHIVYLNTSLEFLVFNGLGLKPTDLTYYYDLVLNCFSINVYSKSAEYNSPSDTQLEKYPRFFTRK